MLNTSFISEFNSSYGSVLYNWPEMFVDHPSKIAQLSALKYDVVILGAGVVGAALAYELSQYQIKILLIDKNFDVGEGTSKANSAIIHTGFDAEPSSLESELVTKSSFIWPSLAKKLKVPFSQKGALLVAFSADQARELSHLAQKSLSNGVSDVEFTSKDDIRQLEPNISTKTKCGLFIPREGIIDSFAVSHAFSEIAASNGVDIVFGVEITHIDESDNNYLNLHSNSGFHFHTRTIVNVAGLGSKILADSYQGSTFEINPRRGQFLVYDKNLGNMINHILLPVPTKKTKGKLLTPTIFGNLLAGPTAEDLQPGDPDATATTLSGIEEVRAAAVEMCPNLTEHLPIASYAGARCNCSQGSYKITRENKLSGIITVTGVRSTGLSASPMLAKFLVDELRATNLISLSPNLDANNSRDDSSWPGWWIRPWDNFDKFSSNSKYGRLVCFCESISEGEICDALDTPLLPSSLDSLKRRTRALAGRCQGFNCQIKVAEILASKRGLDLNCATKCGPGTELFSSPNKGDSL